MTPNTYLLEIKHQVGERFTAYEHHVVEASNIQMVKWWFHKDMNERGYSQDTHASNKHTYENHHIGARAEIREIKELDVHEASVMRDYHPTHRIPQPAATDLRQQGVHRGT